MGMIMIIETIKRFFGTAHQPAPPETVIVDQGAYFDSLKLRQQRWQEDEEEEERQRQRVAYMVWEWARDVVRKRTKLPLPPKLPRNDVVRDWMNGLFVQEIFALSKSDGFAIMHHIYSDIRIENVRPVQKLPESALRFPAPQPEPDCSRPGASGGPGRK
jgi:hypothetical protein